MSRLDIKTHWSSIHRHFMQSFSSNFHVSIASINAESLPVNTPIGSLFLNRDYTGFYFEKYPSTLPENAKSNPEVCILAVNSGMLFWVRSLFKNKFDLYPGVRLYGTLGALREPSESETSRLKRRMKTTRFLRGNKTLWGDMHQVREINFHKAEIIQLGKMTHHFIS